MFRLFIFGILHAKAICRYVCLPGMFSSTDASLLQCLPWCRHCKPFTCPYHCHSFIFICQSNVIRTIRKLRKIPKIKCQQIHKFLGHFQNQSKQQVTLKIKEASGSLWSCEPFCQMTVTENQTGTSLRHNRWHLNLSMPSQGCLGIYLEPVNCILLF